MSRFAAFDDSFFDQDVYFQIASYPQGERFGTSQSLPAGTKFAAMVEQDPDRSRRDETPHGAPEGTKRYRVFTQISPNADTDDVATWKGLELTAVSKSTDLSGQGVLWLTEMTARS